MLSLGMLPSSMLFVCSSTVSMRVALVGCTTVSALAGLGCGVADGAGCVFVAEGAVDTGAGGDCPICSGGVVVISDFLVLHG